MTTSGQGLTVGLENLLDLLIGDGRAVDGDLVLGSSGLKRGEELSTGSLYTVLDELSTKGVGERVVGGDVLKDRVVFVGAGTRALVQLLAGGDLGVFDLAVGGLEAGEVLKSLDVLGGIKLDETVVVGLLGELVDQTTREDFGHLLGVDGGDLLPETRGRGVATVFGEVDGVGEGSVVVDEGLVTGALEGVVTAPLVRVDTEEIGISDVTAFEVGGEGRAEIKIIGIGVTDGDDTRDVVGDVCLHVANDGLDVVGGGGSGLGIEDDFVSGEEHEGVGVAGEHVNDLEDMLEVIGRVCGPGQVLVEMLALEGGVDVEDEVDAGLRHERHALIVRDFGINGVHADGVDAELLEEVDIARALVEVGEGVVALLELGGAAGLVINTLDLWCC